jgi:FkbM family methyltransferase
MKVFIDVGCHVGYYSFIWAKDPKNLIYAFEPVPELYDKLKEKEEEYTNFKVFNYAICETDGEQYFNLNNNLATCSLKNFTEGYTSFYTKDKIIVKTKRLDTFCEEMGIDEICLLKSDAQGSDLEVVKSLGERIIKCEKLLIEAFITPDDNCVYEDEVKKDKLVDFLKEKGFSLDSESIDGDYSDLIFTNKNNL